MTIFFMIISGVLYLIISAFWILLAVTLFETPTNKKEWAEMIIRTLFWPLAVFMVIFEVLLIKFKKRMQENE